MDQFHTLSLPRIRFNQADNEAEANTPAPFPQMETTRTLDTLAFSLFSLLEGANHFTWVNPRHSRGLPR